MPRVEFEPTIPVFEGAKTVYALDRAATVIGIWWNDNWKGKPKYREETCLQYHSIHHKSNIFLFIFLGFRVTLSPPGTSATIWPIIPAPDDR
jgi:hypothetical protein